MKNSILIGLIIAIKSKIDAVVQIREAQNMRGVKESSILKE